MDFENTNLSEWVKFGEVFQLAIEFDYLCETYDRFLPHKLFDGVAMVEPRFVKSSYQYVSDLSHEVIEICKERKIPLEEFKRVRREICGYTHSRVTECYKQYEGNYLLEGKYIEKENNRDDHSGDERALD